MKAAIKFLFILIPLLNFSQFTEEKNVFSHLDYSLAIDFDFDGDKDLVSISGAYIVLSENSGNGVFKSPRIIADSLADLRDFKINDIDNNGTLDLIVLTGRNNGKILLLTSDSQNNLKTPIFITNVINNSNHINLIDINNDGLMDIIEGNSYNSNYILNQGNNSFGNKNLLFNGRMDQSIVIDHNNDGKEELAWRAGGFLKICTNSSNSLTNTQVIRHNPYGLTSFASADINHNGMIDFISVSYQDDSIYISTQNSSGNFNNSSLKGISDPVNIECIDINQNGLEDIIIMKNNSEGFYLAKNQGALSFSNITRYDSNYINTNNLTLCDLNGDNKQDLFFNHYDEKNSSGLSLFFRDSINNLAKQNFYGEEFSFDYFIHRQDVFSIDYDSDNDQDIFIHNSPSVSDTVKIIVLENKGNNSFESKTIMKSPVSIVKFSGGDLNNDGTIDFVVHDFSDSAWIFMSNGTNYTVQFLFKSSNSHIIDMNNDGFLDIVLEGTRNILGSLNNLGINDGLGNFNFSLTNFNFSFNNSKIKDIDKDGDLDIISIFNDDIQFFENQGNFNFSLLKTYDIGPKTILNYNVDFIDNDSIIDVVLFVRRSLDEELIFCKSIGGGNHIEYNIPISYGIINDYDYFDNVVINFLDVNNDGQNDILVTLVGRGGYESYFAGFINQNNASAFSFTPYRIFYGKPRITFLDDFNNDSKLDVLLYDNFGDKISYLINDVSVNPTTINSIDNKTEFNLYPNPATNQINIEIDNQLLRVELFNLMGERVLKVKKGKTVNISHLPSGVYTVLVLTNTGYASKLFIKK